MAQTHSQPVVSRYLYYSTTFADHNYVYPTCLPNGWRQDHGPPIGEGHGKKKSPSACDIYALPALNLA